jgi:hypothetical protein
MRKVLVAVLLKDGTNGRFWKIKHGDEAVHGWNVVHVNPGALCPVSAQCKWCDDLWEIVVQSRVGREG